MLTNSSQYPVTFTLIFPESMFKTCNFRVPVTECSFQVKAREKDIVLKLTKNDLMHGWGENLKDFRVLVDRVDMADGMRYRPQIKDYPDMRLDCKTAQDEAESLAQAQAVEDAANGNQMMNSEQVEFEADVGNTGIQEGGINDPSHPDYGKVSCGICTYLNFSTNARCDMCESPLN